MKSKASSKSQSNITELDSSEENEIYDQFNAIMVPVSRTLSKSPQSDEGIEPDSDSRKTSVTRCWSLDSSSTNGDDDVSKANQWQKRRSRLKVSRCYSADSAVVSDDDHNKGEYIFIIFTYEVKKKKIYHKRLLNILITIIKIN